MHQSKSGSIPTQTQLTLKLQTRKALFGSGNKQKSQQPELEG